MKTHLALVAALAVAAPVTFAQTAPPIAPPPPPPAAQPPAPPAPPVPAPTLLAAGDKAPPLSIEKWVKGEPVTGFEKGKVYVVEFWATWCGPCIKSMPHLSEIQKEHKEHGLTVVGVTSADGGNTLEKVEKMVADKGDAMGYTVAWDTARTTSDAYMKAAGQNGIPCSFVINQDGNIAYIGHPMMLDEVIQPVLDGKWDPKPDSKKLAEAMSKLDEIFGSAEGDPKVGLQAFNDLEAQHPNMFKDLQGAKLTLQLRSADYDGAQKSLDTVFTNASKNKDGGELASLAMMLGDKQLNPEKKFAEFSMKAAEASAKVSGEEDVQALLALAFANKLNGQKDKAVEFAKKADSLATGNLKRYTSAQLQTIQAD